nr:hypothetical protein [Tanacetum cinerariifolium]
MEEGTKNLATVDGILRTVTESSLRRNLKLQDEEGIRFNEFSSNIATTLVCLATNRTYNFSKMSFDGLVKNVNNKGEGSGTPTEPHHTPSPEALLTSHTTYSSPTLPPVPTAPIPTVTPSETTPIRQYIQRAKIAQSSALPHVADEPASPLRDVSQGEACPTDSSFIADQDRENIAKSSTLPHDPAPRVTSPAAVDGSMQHTIDELTALCTSLQRQHSEMIVKLEAQEVEINRLKARVKLLEDREGLATERSGDDAPIKRRNLDEREAPAERVSDDSEEMETVLTSMDAATILAGKVDEVPTGSSSIPTASPPATGVATGSDVVPTASPIFATAIESTQYTRRKCKETMVEYETPKKQKVQEQIDAQVARELEEKMAREDQRKSEQIARDAEIAQIHAEEELQIMIDTLDRRNETVAKYLQEYQQFALKLPLERRIELISDLIKYQDNYAKSYKYQSQQRKPLKRSSREIWKQLHDFIPIGSKEEVERFKRKGTRFEQESTKKLKTSEEVPEEVKSPDEVPEEKKVHTEEKRSYWKMTRLGGGSASYQFFIDMLKHLDRENLNQLWRIVKDSLSNRPPTSDKEMELWNLMHALIEWKLYDPCGVHHVTARDKEIFMLVEKDYPLRKGLAIVMISYKLQVENYSRMANDLILKIFKIGRIVRNKMHKAFPLPVIDFPLAEEVSTASEESSHYQKKKDATAKRIALLGKYPMITPRL